MTREQKTYRLAYWIASFILAGVLFSGYHKILDPAGFALAVYRFHLLPGLLVNPVALWLPWLEMVCAVSLLFIPRYRVAALWTALVLLLVFTAAIALNMLRGSAFGCGCFGAAATDDPLGAIELLRNGGLIALALLALHAGRKARS